MFRRNSLLLAAVMAALAGACRDDGPAATGPSETDPTTEPRADVAAGTATYTVKDLGTLGGPYSGANAINNIGETVGSSHTSTGQQHAFIYRAGVMRDLGALAGGTSKATAINNLSVVVGWSTVVSGATRAVRWKDGTKKNLGTLGGRNSEATGINDEGVIVGWSETAQGHRHAFVWKDGVMTDIGTLGGTFSMANAINNAGRVVGASSTATGESHAFAWKDGRFQDLGDAGTEFGSATAINSGRIVGIVGPGPDAVGAERDGQYPFILADGRFTIFRTRERTAEVHAINADGTVVGSDMNLREVGHEGAWVRYVDGTEQYLPELSAGVAQARGINRYGTIVGVSETPDGFGRAVLWRRQ